MPKEASRPQWWVPHNSFPDIQYTRGFAKWLLRVEFKVSATVYIKWVFSLKPEGLLNPTHLNLMNTNAAWVQPAVCKNPTSPLITLCGRTVMYSGSILPPSPAIRSPAWEACSVKMISTTPPGESHCRAPSCPASVFISGESSRAGLTPGKSSTLITGLSAVIH